jgi:hypothetical protein
MRYRKQHRTTLGVVAILAVAVLVGACSSAGGASNGSPTEVQIILSELRSTRPRPPLPPARRTVS